MTTDVLKLPGDYIINAVKGDMTIDLTSTDRVGTLVVNGNFRVTGQSSQGTNTEPTSISSLVNYDLSFFIGGRLVYPESVVGGFVSTKQIQIDAGGPGSVAKCITAPTNKSQTLTIKKNSEVIGTITFSVGDTVGSLSIPQPVELAIGDIVSVITPLDIDAQFADIFVTLVGKSLLVTLE